ncbi:MAG TPA: dihydroorotate dehydrogenase electron transfer subunit [Verrucomicrobiae bacterium]|nr:dihydroorotate dehydrogenase electron transfer subunit [Verrucomicrobiae bacterium]
MPLPSMLAVPMLEQTVQIVSNERDTDSYFRLVLRAPLIAPLIQPGQFAHIRVLPLKDALLRRPFSIFQVAGDTFSILYKTVGKGTDALARLGAGEELSVIAPLGHGFTVPERGGETPLLVAGGYGMAAMYLLAQRSPQKGVVFVGGRRRADILCETEFQALGWDVRVTTEDGSHGQKGLVTEPLLAELRSSRGNEAQTEHWEIGNRKSEISQSLLTSAATRQKVKVFACGPTPMLKAVGKIAEEFNVPAELSMDEHMCCGVGVCLTCVIPVKTRDGWEYQRTCTEGPVFDARDIVWEITK